MATRRWISTGSGDWASTSNWSGSAVPTAGDTVVFQKNSVDVSGSLDQSTVTNVILQVHQSFTGRLGDADNYLQIGCQLIEIGRDDENLRPAGSPRLNINSGTVSCTIDVFNTGSVSADTGFLPVRLLTTNVASDIRIRKGKVQIAGFTAETTTIDDLEIGEENGSDQNTQVLVGGGVTMDDMNVRSGSVVVRCAVDTMAVYGGTVRTEGTGTVAAANVRGGTMVCNSSGTITTLTLTESGTATFDQANVARTVTSLSVGKGSTLRYHPTVTITNGIQPNATSPIAFSMG